MKVEELEKVLLYFPKMNVDEFYYLVEESALSWDSAKAIVIMRQEIGKYIAVAKAASRYKNYLSCHDYHDYVGCNMSNPTQCAGCYLNLVLAELEL